MDSDTVTWCWVPQDLHVLEIHAIPSLMTAFIQKFRIALFALLTLGINNAAHAAPEVSNVRAAQQAGTKLVDIICDLVNPDGNSTILIDISVNGGRTWDVPVRSISGAVGEDVPPRTNRKATWNAGADFDGNLSDRCQARVTADEEGTPMPPPGMAFIPAGPFQMGAEVDKSSPRIPGMHYQSLRSQDPGFKAFEEISPVIQAVDIETEFLDTQHLQWPSDRGFLKIQANPK